MKSAVTMELWDNANFTDWHPHSFWVNDKKDKKDYCFEIRRDNGPCGANANLQLGVANCTNLTNLRVW